MATRVFVARALYIRVTLESANKRPYFRPFHLETDVRSKSSGITDFVYVPILPDSCGDISVIRTVEPTYLSRFDRTAVSSPGRTGCPSWNVLLNEGDPLDVQRRMNSIIGRVLAIPAAAVTNSGTSSSRALHVDLASQQVSIICHTPLSLDTTTVMCYPLVCNDRRRCSGAHRACQASWLACDC